MAFEKYTKLDNAMIENALCKITLNAYQWRILMHIIRHTFGWNRTEFYTSYRSIATATGIDVSSVARVVKTLEAKLIIATRKARNETLFQFNANYMTWRIDEKAGLFSPAREASTGGQTGAQAVEALTPEQIEEEGRRVRDEFWAKYGGRRVGRTTNT